MALAVFLILAGIWAIFLLPPLWAERRRSRPSPRPLVRPLADEPAATVTPITGSNPGGPPPTVTMVQQRLDRDVVLARRRRVVAVLAGSAIVTLLVAILWVGVWSFALHVAVDALLITYLVTLRNIVKAREAPTPPVAMPSAARERPRVYRVG